MGIAADKGNKNYIKQFRLEIEKNMHDSIVYFLNSVGLQCLAYARENGLYTDRTGNLRSSVGYVIMNKGNLLEVGGFSPSVNNAAVEKDGYTGAATGEDYAIEIAEQMSSDSSSYVLVFVAGMFYAEYVEKKGYDVLIGTQIMAEEYATNLFNQVYEQSQTK